MQLFVTGLSHRTAPVAVRERLAIVPDELEARLRHTAGLPGVREVAIISTCNRVEIYGAFSDCDEAVASVRGLVCEVLAAAAAKDPRLAGEDPETLFGRHLYTRVRREAVHHLFRVAASLDSLVIGEPQILGQVKEAFDLAAKVGTAGPLLGAVFPRAFRVAKKIRRDTAIAASRVSISSVAVDLARQFCEGFAGRQVLIIGAGKMADLAARVLRRDGANLMVINRTLARAEELAARLGGTALPWDSLAQALARADIVISSTGARTPVLGKALVAEAKRSHHGRPLVLIDIAVPRDVEPEVGSLDGVYLYDIDDLQKVVQENLEDRRQEGARAEAVIEEELLRFLTIDKGRAAGPTIAALRARALGVARAEGEKLLANLGSADERTRRGVQAMGEAIVAKLLHGPSVALKKEAASGGEGPDLVEAVHKLFDLPPVQPLGADADENVTADGPAGAEDADVQKASRP
jgi:glutamyl-tRNA reductase